MTARLQLPPVGTEPGVSLIMVVYGGYASARASLEAVRDATAGGYELLVVDNASPDGAGHRLREEVDGARFVMAGRNLGFGPAVNLAALQARGRYLGVLNSDIAPTSGWLEPLLGLLDADRRAGAAAPLYTGPDTAVQEAGGLLGCDGYGYGYGDRLGAGAPELGFARYVDYASAAALIVRRDAFEAVGGFDARYGTGYYEDADLSFAMRERGWLTVVEPRSRVVHHGQGSFTGRARARLSARNRKVFAARFPTQLAGRPRLSRPPYDPHRELIVRDWWAPERFLVIDDGGLGSLADHVQEMRPLDRVTRLGGPAAAGGASRFVETIPTPGDPAGWLTGRRHHYSVVVHRDLPAGWAAALGRTQPQAVTVAISADRPDARSVLAAAGIPAGGR